VQIDDKVELRRADFENKFDEAQQMIIDALFVNQNAFVEIFVVLNKVSEFFVGKQCQMSRREIFFQRAQCGRHQHQIAQVHQIYHENFHKHSPKIFCRFIRLTLLISCRRFRDCWHNLAVMVLFPTLEQLVRGDNVRQLKRLIATAGCNVTLPKKYLPRISGGIFYLKVVREFQSRISSCSVL
jgi:hypothetical protein